LTHKISPNQKIQNKITKLEAEIIGMENQLKELSEENPLNQAMAEIYWFFNSQNPDREK